MPLFHSISWPQFTKALLTASAIYYTACAVFYWRPLANLFVGRSSKIQQKSSQAPSAGAVSPRSAMNAADIHELLQDLKHILIAASLNDHNKGQLLTAIRSMLAGYRRITDKDMRAEISKHIAHESKEQCAISLSDAEMDMLWIG